MHFWKLAMRQTNKGGRKDLPSVFIFEYSSFVFIGNKICQLLDPFVGQRSTKPLSRGVCPFSTFHVRSGGPSSLILFKKDACSQVNRNICPKHKQNVSQLSSVPFNLLVDGYAIGKDFSHLFGVKFTGQKSYRWRHNNWPIRQWVIQFSRHSWQSIIMSIIFFPSEFII